MSLDTSKKLNKVSYNGVMFPIASSGTNFLQWKCDNTGSLSYAFYNYQGESVDEFLLELDTSQVTDMSYMLSDCHNMKNVNLSNLNTSNVTTMEYMFFRSQSFKNLDLSNFDTSNLTNMSGMFSTCMSVQTLDLSGWDTSKVTNMSNTFSSCRILKTILGVLDVSASKYFGNMFFNCSKLETVTLKNIKLSLVMGSSESYGTLLDDPTVINTAKELWDLTGATSQKLTVSTPTNAKLDTIYVKLITATDDMIAKDPNINSKKPCEVCASTDEGAMTLREYIISKNWSIA